MTLSDPLQQYSARQAVWTSQKQIDEDRFSRIANVRGLAGLAEAVLAYLVLRAHSLPGWTLLPIPIVFVGLVISHNRVDRRRKRAEKALAYYRRAMARVEDRWMGSGPTGEQYADPEHIYSGDLDVLGKGSLFQLVANVQTSAGGRKLAEWLLLPATAAAARERQAAVRELAGRLQLREDLGLIGSEIEAEVHIETLTQWADQAHVHFPAWLSPLAVLLGLVGLLAVVGFFAQAVPIAVVAGLLAVNLSLRYVFRTRVRRVLRGSEKLGDGLRVLAFGLRRFQQEPADSAYLAGLIGRLNTGGGDAPKRILQLQRWLDWMNSGDHVLIRTLQPIILWDEQIAVGLERWRQRWGRQMPAWVNTVAELEALSSLAAVAFERPAWAFPDIVESSEPVFIGLGLRHPLLPEASAVANDLQFAGPAKVYVVSGSNMSGKSTLLRTVGLNTALALAGGPVAAAALTVSRLQVAASIRIIDSLADHRSRFMAEILRVRQVIGLTERATPVLFLLDELFSGTNSHDRSVGAAGVIRKLIAAGAIGLVTTHDLALAQIETQEPGTVANVSFEEDFANGEMHFDYRLRAGAVKRSNALELMRMVGIEI